MNNNTNEKKGISLVGFIVVLIILVCVEGFYIIKLKNKDNDSNTQPSTISKNDNTNDLLGDTPLFNLSELNTVDENRK